MGQVKDSHPRVEPGRRHGHEGRQSAHRQRSRSGNFSGLRTKIRAHVLLRRARVNEVGFEIVNTDLESRYRLRRLLVDAMNQAPKNKDQQWAGERKI